MLCSQMNLNEYLFKATSLPWQNIKFVTLIKYCKIKNTTIKMKIIIIILLKLMETSGLSFKMLRIFFDAIKVLKTFSFLAKEFRIFFDFLKFGGDVWFLDQKA